MHHDGINLKENNILFAHFDSQSGVGMLEILKVHGNGFDKDWLSHNKNS
jgi:hypothetical protein